MKKFVNFLFHTIWGGLICGMLLIVVLLAVLIATGVIATGDALVEQTIEIIRNSAN
jgi:hypothetical protein